LLEIFPHAVLTQDWQPRGHVSFASQHGKRLPFDTASTAHGEQMLWPDHCVMGSEGAEFAPGLATVRASLILRKGRNRGLDAASAFTADDSRTPTGLAGWLQERGVRRVFLAGVPLDHAVLATARDARRAKFEVAVVEDAVRGLHVRGTPEDTWLRFAELGVRRVESEGFLLSP
jgi:nicotinamidase/pyrazinamidase